MKLALTPQRKLLSARTRLMADHPFFATVLASLRMVDVTDDPLIDTLATDGVHLYYDLNFVKKHNKKQLVFVLAHEVMHVVFYHCTRRNNRDPELWNIACDYAINGELVELGLEMPERGLLDPAFKGLSAEKIYAKLLKLPKEKRQRLIIKLGASTLGSDIMEPEAQAGSSNTATYQQIEAAITQAIARGSALQRQKKPGDMPGSLGRLINLLLKPQVNWRVQLRAFIDQINRDDYTWMAPNRRYLSAGVHLPSVRTVDTIRHVTIVVDTSGSIDDVTLQEFGAEIDGIFGDGFVELITVIYADTKVQRVETFNRGDHLQLCARGGGGTAFSAVFNFMRHKLEVDPSVIVFFTDLYVSDFGKRPDAPVLWAVHGRDDEPSAPFGNILHLPAPQETAA